MGLFWKEASHLIQERHKTDFQSTGPGNKKKISVKLKIFSSASILTFVLDAQKNRLIETVLLSTHNICFC